MSDWTVDSNSALSLSLGTWIHTPPIILSSQRFIVRAPLDKDVLTKEENYEDFHPRFTYPVRALHAGTYKLCLIYLQHRYSVKKKRYMATLIFTSTYALSLSRDHSASANPPHSSNSLQALSFNVCPSLMHKNSILHQQSTTYKQLLSLSSLQLRELAQFHPNVYSRSWRCRVAPIGGWPVWGESQVLPGLT